MQDDTLSYENSNNDGLIEQNKVNHAAKPTSTLYSKSLTKVDQATKTTTTSTMKRF